MKYNSITFDFYAKFRNIFSILIMIVNLWSIQSENLREISQIFSNHQFQSDKKLSTKQIWFFVNETKRLPSPKFAIQHRVASAPYLEFSNYKKYSI
jgi:hypothetical protein